MPITPKSPSSILRSLGADDSLLNTKIKATAKEAEQRWPLFRALAPAKAEATPALSDDEKAVWQQQKAAPAVVRKPVLSRAGVGGKLAAGLGKLVAPALSTAAATRAATPQAAPKKPVAATRSAAQTPGPTPRSPMPPIDHPQVATTAEVEPQKVARTSLFRPAPDAVDSPVPHGTGLFGAVSSGKVPAASAARPLFPARASAPADATMADDSLDAMFSRIEGRPAAPAKTPKPKSSVMRRIGKR